MPLSPVDPREKNDNYKNSWANIFRLTREGFSWSGRERNRVFFNLEGKDFVDASYVTSLDFPDDARAVLAVDIDFDTDLDLVFVNRNSPRIRVMQNLIGDKKPAIMLLLEGKPPNTGALGARVILEVILQNGERRKFIESVNISQGFLAGQSRYVHLGLGKVKKIVALSVRWRKGVVERFPIPGAPGYYLLKEGTGELKRLDFAKINIEPQPLPSLVKKNNFEIVLSTELFFPPFWYGSFDGKEGIFSLNVSDRPLLVLGIASWCLPCRKEIEEIKKWDRELLDSFDLVGLSFDKDFETAKRFAEEISFKAPFIMLDTKAFEAIEYIFRRIIEPDPELALPFSFLLAPGGRLVAIWLGTIEEDSLSKALRAIEFTGNQLRLFAAPRGGRVSTEPLELPYHFLTVPLIELKLLPSWREVFDFAKDQSSYTLLNLLYKELLKLPTTEDNLILLDKVIKELD